MKFKIEIPILKIINANVCTGARARTIQVNGIRAVQLVRSWRSVNYSMFVLETFLFCFAENVCFRDIFRIETKMLYLEWAKPAEQQNASCENKFKMTS